MNFTANTPTIKVWVNKGYLTQFKEEGNEEAYLVAVKSQANEPLKFTVHLATGALWSGLPIEALGFEEDFEVKHSTPVLQPYSCLEGSIQTVQYNYLKNYEAEVKIGDTVQRALYLFTVDVMGEGLANDPEQYKTHNIVALEESGQLAALPNNYCRFVDKHFVDKDGLDKVRSYKRSSIKYYAGS